MKDILKVFQLEGTPIYCERYGNGHINETYHVKTDTGREYILQLINHHVFRDVPALMENITAVTRHLASRDSRPRHVLTLVPTADGETYAKDADGEYWRLYDFITESLCLDKPETAADFYQSGVAFGTFQNLLADFPADTLHETIPRFHDTPNRYANLHKAIKEDVCGRAANVQSEIERALGWEKDADALMSLYREGTLPLRVTHNDTKLNNVMLDAKTRQALCVIDLDTVMPGFAANDFGDSIRFGAATAAEDETDLSKMTMSLELYETYAKGFLGACGSRLTQTEIGSLPMGAKLMTLECGIRFLTDYLQGDVYFHIRRPGHNLDRCRTQLQLVADMETKWDKMCEIVEKAHEALNR